MVHPPVSLYLCIKRFPREIRKKVRKLLYHSLRTNMVIGCMTEVRVTPRNTLKILHFYGMDARVSQ